MTTKTKDASLAWRAHYLDGVLVAPKPGLAADPKPVAGRPGTQITVEDLFFNVPIRRRAFRSPADEFHKIMDMVGRYAIHCSGVAFSCRKAGEASNSLSIQAQASTVDRIQQIYGLAVSTELIRFTAADGRWAYEAHGLVTNANYHVKKTTLLLFVNHRAVESASIKRAMENLYGAFLPKGGHPFVYLSLEIDPSRVDVNVHPTKKEVHFLNEDEIIAHVCAEIETRLAAVDTSRTFVTQKLLPGAGLAIPAATTAARGDDDDDDDDNDNDDNDNNSDSDNDDQDDNGRSPGMRPAPAPTHRRRRNSNNLVRTDTKERKITSMFLPLQHPSSSSAFNEAAEPLAAPEEVDYQSVPRAPVPCRLLSIQQLRAVVRRQQHAPLGDLLAAHSFVGIVDEHRRLAAIQAGVGLYLVDYGHLCFHYFYQLGLSLFANFGAIRFTPPLNLRRLLTMAAEAEAALMPPAAAPDTSSPPLPAAIVARVHDELMQRRQMLLDYFSLEISPAGDLVSLPLLVKGYTPSMAKLPSFLLRLGPCVDWSEEKACFASFLTELATYYVPEQLPPAPPPPLGDEEKQDADANQPSPPPPPEVRTRRQHVRWAVEHIFFPAFKANLVATKPLMDGAIMEVANLKGLYKVFERC